MKQISVCARMHTCVCVVVVGKTWIYFWEHLLWGCRKLLKEPCQLKFWECLSSEPSCGGGARCSFLDAVVSIDLPVSREQGFGGTGVGDKLKTVVFMCSGNLGTFWGLIPAFLHTDQVCTPDFIQPLCTLGKCVPPIPHSLSVHSHHTPI